MNTSDAQESPRPSQARPAHRRDETSSRADRFRWVPPIVALLLLALVLLSLQVPSGGAGDGTEGNGNGPALAGTGQGSDTRELGGTSSGTADAQGGIEQQGGESPEQAGTAEETERAASADPDDGNADATRLAPTADARDVGPIGSVATSPREQTAPLPALGFATDLAAAPEPNERTPIETPNASAAPTGTPSDGAPGTPGLASFFGAEGHGTKFAYLLDKSGSMSGAPFEAAKAELIRSLRALAPHEHFFVAFYDGRAELMPGERLVPATPANVERAVAWVRSVSLGGSTDPTEALVHVLSRVKPDTIWLLSDGAFSAQVVDTIANHNPRGRTHINTLAFINRSGEALLKIIADQNNGDYRFVPRP
ncbi:MAG: hypothetical protein AAGE65_08895 [Planctomycetota bacterium]